MLTREKIIQKTGGLNLHPTNGGSLPIKRATLNYERPFIQYNQIIIVSQTSKPLFCHRQCNQITGKYRQPGFVHAWV